MKQQDKYQEVLLDATELMELTSSEIYSYACKIKETKEIIYGNAR